jgi:uncharacterized metal-binding protein
MSDDFSCESSVAPKLIFSCSGSSDVGELADKAARKMTVQGIGKMFCLAGVGGRVSGIMKSTEAAPAILVIDGFPLNCSKKCLEEAEFKEFFHLQVEDLGMTKGETAVIDDNIDKILTKGKEIFKGNSK